MSEQIQAVLRDCGFFRSLSDASIAKLAGMALIRSYAKGQVIFQQGDPCPGIFVVAEGVVKVAKTAPTGKEHVLHMVLPGMTFAEVAAIGRFPCPANAEAMEPTRCVLVLQDRFAAALEQDHALCLQLMGSFAGWVRHLIGLLEDIVLRDATGRVARYLLQVRVGKTSDRFALPMLKRDLASHLNLTSETLSRTLRRLADAGLIELPDAQQICIMDASGLAEVAAGIPPAEFD